MDFNQETVFLEVTEYCYLIEKVSISRNMSKKRYSSLNL